MNNDGKEINVVHFRNRDYLDAHHCTGSYTLFFLIEKDGTQWVRVLNNNIEIKRISTNIINIIEWGKELIA